MEDKSEDRMKHQILFVKEGKTYEAEEGMTVLEAEIAAGLKPDAPCGGRGKCGKCKVRIDGKEVLACQTVIQHGLEVETLHGETENQILAAGYGRKVSFHPGELPADVKSPLLAAVDLGSTSVVAYLLDGRTGEQLSVKSILNPYRMIGNQKIISWRT